MKKILKNKWVWIITVFVFLIILGVVYIFLFSHNETTHTKQDSTLISLDDEIILLIESKQSYNECWKPFKRQICSDITSEILNYTLYNKTSGNLKEETYEASKKELTIEETIIEFIERSLQKEQKFEKATIISGYDFDNEDKEKITNNFKDYGLDFEFIYQEGGISITADSPNYYTINFDTDGGSSIDSVVVRENEIVEKPEEPTKEGYTFVRWELDEEEYDFKEPVTEEITLKAIWKKVNSNNATKEENTNSEKNNNTTSSKINLNNNISITEYHVDSGNMDCFYYMFVTNLKEVFPEAKITKINNNPSEVSFWHTKDRQDYEVSTEEINEYLSSGTLKINTSKENNFINILNKYKNGSYMGIGNVEYTLDNHRFIFSYDYISFNGLNVGSIGEKANKEIMNALSSATKFNGPCGGFSNFENKTLTEDLCTKYHLDCGRW